MSTFILVSTFAFILIAAAWIILGPDDDDDSAWPFW